MVSVTASCTYPYRETVVYRMPDSEYFTVITPYFSNIRLAFTSRTYASYLNRKFNMLIEGGPEEKNITY